MNFRQRRHRLRQKSVQLRQQSIYLLPNAFTLAALFAGFFAVVQAMNRHFDTAAMAIFVAMLLDGMDGRIARLTHTQSAFGAEFDSLSDMVSFGVAPALVVYEWVLNQLGLLGWATAFVYCACAAFRLARFNTNLMASDKHFFQGMPSPTAAALVAGLVGIAHAFHWDVEETWLRYLALGVTAFSGLTMVTSVPYYSFKSLNVRRNAPFTMLLALLFVLLVFVAAPIYAVCALIVLYALSGYVLWFWRLFSDRKNPAAAHAAPPDAKYSNAPEYDKRHDESAPS